MRLVRLVGVVAGAAGRGTAFQACRRGSGGILDLAGFSAAAGQEFHAGCIGNAGRFAVVRLPDPVSGHGQGDQENQGDQAFPGPAVHRS